MRTDERLQHLKTWLTTACHLQQFELVPLVGGASFRRYFRVFSAEKTWIAMDAPPSQEDSQSFVAVDKAFAALGLHVPNIIASDLTLGYLLLEDLGDDLFYRILTAENAKALYDKGLDAIVTIQQVKEIPNLTLPHLDYRFMLEELYGFQVWYLEQYLKQKISTTAQKILDHAFDFIAKLCAEQQQVCIHRDYHSQNLMCLSNGELGILDFQSAMIGPVTYDAASLLKDCYVSWPAEMVRQLALSFYDRLKQCSRYSVGDADSFIRAFDIMALQRHLKAILTYARKKIRDKDNSYLQFIPCALNYVFETCRNYQELSAFHEFIQQQIPIKEEVT